jgi:hypothetical protein
MASKPEEESDGGLERAELLRMYLDVLRLRLSEDEFRVLGLLIKGVFDFMASGRSQGETEISDEDEPFATDAVRGELMTLMGILTTGKLDKQLVDFGDGIRALVDAEAAADPARLEELHELLRRDRERRHEEDEVLRGIAEASGMSP